MSSRREREMRAAKARAKNQPGGQTRGWRDRMDDVRRKNERERDLTSDELRARTHDELTKYNREFQARLEVANRERQKRDLDRQRQLDEAQRQRHQTEEHDRLMRERNDRRR